MKSLRFSQGKMDTSSDLPPANTSSSDSLDITSLLTTSIQDLVPTERQRVQDALTQLANLNILITGLTGSGKSSLANAFLGKKHGERGAAKEGEDIEEGCTKHVRGRASAREEQSGITIWDTPGLIDGSAKEQEYLEEMQCFWKRKNRYDLVIFCIKAGTRFVLGKDNNDVKAMTMLNKKFGQEFWKNAVIVLTFANNIESNNPTWRSIPQAEKEAKFEDKIKKFEVQIKENMKYVGVKQESIDRIQVVPAGHRCIPSGLEGRKWFTNLFMKCLKTIPTSKGQASFLGHNLDRITIEGEFSSCPQCDIILQEDFIPAELLRLRKEYARNGGLIGMLGGPLGLITIPLGWWAGARYGEAEYVRQLTRTRALSGTNFSINRDCIE